jgi:hypothetical protein
MPRAGRRGVRPALAGGSQGSGFPTVPEVPAADALLLVGPTTMFHGDLARYLGEGEDAAGAGAAGVQAKPGADVLAGGRRGLGHSWRM